MTGGLGPVAATATLESDAKHILGQFFYGIPWGWSRLHKLLNVQAQTIGDDQQHRNARAIAGETIRSHIEHERDVLFKEAGTAILTYLTRYRVKSSTADPFKLAYWFGVALANRVGEKDSMAKRCVLLVMLELLDNFCEAHCGKRFPKDMREKMDLSIAEGKHLDEYGVYGLYHSFKSVSKSHCNGA